MEHPPFYSTFEEFSEYFIKDPKLYIFKGKTKNEDKQRLSLARYLFSKYKIPKFLNSAWDTKASYEEKLIYVCLATGQSLYKTYFSHLFTKKETHIFTNCKHNLSINQVKVYAIAYAESNNEKNAIRLALSKISEKEQVNFWKDTIRFLSRDPNLPKSKGINDLVDYINMRLMENKGFTISGKGYTIHSLTEKMYKWHRDLGNLKKIGLANWKGYPIEDIKFPFTLDKKPVAYIFTQIKSAQILQKEGNAMRHCVLGYKMQCEEGKTSIWSMTFNQFGSIKRALTLEVTKGYLGYTGYSITQMRGLANREPKPREKRFVEKFKLYINK